jgi:hypothetical protein
LNSATAPSTALTRVTDRQGTFRFENVSPGHYRIVFTLINFATSAREVNVTAVATPRVDAVLQLALNADAENLVGIAQSASQGAITAQQLDERPLMRDDLDMLT